MPSIEHFPKADDQEVFDRLHEIGEQDPVFGDTGEFDGRNHEKELQAGLLAVAQAAHDQVIGQGKQGYMSARYDTISSTNGLAYAHDPMTNMAYMISTSATEGGDMHVGIRSATSSHKRAREPKFHKRHKLAILYHPDGSVEDAERFKEGIRDMSTTTVYDAEDPSAFLDMGASISRASPIDRRKFEKLDERSKHEFLIGKVGRLTAVRSFFGF